MYPLGSKLPQRNEKNVAHLMSLTAMYGRVTFISINTSGNTTPCIPSSRKIILKKLSREKPRRIQLQTGLIVKPLRVARCVLKASSLNSPTLANIALEKYSSSIKVTSPKTQLHFFMKPTSRKARPVQWNPLSIFLYIHTHTYTRRTVVFQPRVPRQSRLSFRPGK